MSSTDHTSVIEKDIFQVNVCSDGCLSTEAVVFVMSVVVLVVLVIDCCGACVGIQENAKY